MFGAGGADNNCHVCHALYHQLVMTSLHAQPIAAPLLPSTNQDACWCHVIQQLLLSRGAAAAQRNSLLDPGHRLLLRLDALPPTDQPHKVRDLHAQLALCNALASVRPSVRPSVCLSVSLSVCPTVCPTVCLSVCLSVRLSVCPTVCPVSRQQQRRPAPAADIDRQLRVTCCRRGRSAANAGSVLLRTDGGGSMELDFVYSME